MERTSLGQQLPGRLGQGKALREQTFGFNIRWRCLLEIHGVVSHRSDSGIVTSCPNLEIKIIYFSCTWHFMASNTGWKLDLPDLISNYFFQIVHFQKKVTGVFQPLAWQNYTDLLDY